MLFSIKRLIIEPYGERLTEQALVIIPDGNWSDLVLRSTAFSTEGYQDMIALIKEEVDRFVEDPLNQRYRASCANVCQATIRKDLLQHREGFDVAFGCCLTIENIILAADIIQQYVHYCYEPQDCVAALKSCQVVERANLMDKFARKLFCHDAAMLTSVFEICAQMKRADLAARIISNFRPRANKSDLEIAEIVLPLIESKSFEHPFEELKGW